MKKFSSTTALAALLLVTAAPVNAICTPATINPGAVQRIRPHMSPAAVSAVLGCVPTKVFPPTEIFQDSLQIWYWGIPQVGMSKIHVAVTFDDSGALSAQYQVISTDPKVPPICNGALRVEPPTTIGNWVPGACP